MSVTVYFANVSKKRNSTYRGTFAVSYDCNLKAPTSLDRPTFLVSADTMDYNAAKWGDRYYFIDDVVSVRNGQWEVSCVLDVLATYKTEITASTQFVTYSSYRTSEWLTDTRVPILDFPHVETSSETIPLFNATGFYCLTVNGVSGCNVFIVDAAKITTLISNVNSWQHDGIEGIFNGSTMGITYDWSSPEKATESFAKMATQTGFIGNAYSNAPQMIRSCIWVPFLPATFSEAGLYNLYLGNWDTGVDAYKCKTSPVVNYVTITLPWTYTDWRRSTCENVYLYLPFVGMINLSSSELAGSTTLTIIYSATATDGVICYQVTTDTGLLVGTYGGSCCANYPIGINQQASAGAITQTVLSGVEKMLTNGINSSLSPVSAASVAAANILAGVQTGYDIQNVAHSTNPSCIGSFGGGAGVGLSLSARVNIVSKYSGTDPSNMVSTMGYPTMQPMSLSGLTGFCQCANAHVAAAAQATELDAIDSYLNTGFFIE